MLAPQPPAARLRCMRLLPPVACALPAQGAFEHCVRAYVTRCECGSLGPRHPDTAAAGHNLGVVLDCLGKCSRGLQLMQEAREVSHCLGV